MNTSKQARQAFDRWRQPKIGPVWDTAWKKMKEYAGHERTITKLQDEVAELNHCLENPSVLLDRRMQVLIKLGCIEMDAEGTAKLTKKGLMASEINEGSSLLMVDLYASGVLRGRPWNVITSAICGFLGDEFNISDCIYYLSLKYALKEIHDAEEECGILSKDSEFVYEAKWLNIFERYLGVYDDPVPLEIICGEYEIYEGDFMKALTKVETLVEEWKTLCTIDENLKDIEELTKFSRIINADSIYLLEAVIAQNKLAKTSVCASD
jgi:superfamily II RNA helicase